MNQTQGLGNVSYSVAHNEVLEISDRQRVAKQLISIIKDYSKKNNFDKLKILDVGCSSGIITKLIAKNGGVVIGIDVDKNAIQIASSNYKNLSNLSFQTASGSYLPFRKNSFDVILCNQVYSYSSNPNRMVAEIYRVLNLRGFCLFTGDNILRPIEPLYRLPFVRLLPKKITKLILKITNHNNFYIGSYKSYWGLKKLFNNFIIKDYTITVLRNPKKFKFKKLLKYEQVIKMIPISILKLLEPFFPTFIYILTKRNPKD